MSTSLTRFRRQSQLALSCLIADPMRPAQAMTFEMAPRCPTLGEKPKRRDFASIRCREPRFNLYQGRVIEQAEVIDTRDDEIRDLKRQLRDKDRQLAIVTAELAEMKRLESVRAAARGSRGAHSKFNQTNGPATISTLPDTPIIRGEVVGGVKTVVKGN